MLDAAAVAPEVAEADDGGDAPLAVLPSESAEYRTRWLYAAQFTWAACFGRFMSLYYLAEGLDESQIGAVFAIGSATGPWVATVVGVTADRLAAAGAAAGGPCTGSTARHQCLVACVFVGTGAFTLQAARFPGISRFATMLLCRVLVAGSITSGNILCDAITVQCLRDRKRYGQERLYGAVTWAIVHLGLGIAIDRFGRAVQHLMFVISGALYVSVIAWLGKPPESLPASKTATRGLAALADNQALYALLWTYATSWCIVAFGVYTICLGIGMTIVENLLFLLFKELGASYFLCGVSVVVTVVFEIPLFALSPKLLSWLGPPVLLVTAGFCYSFRVVGYTLCPGGWYVLIFEPLHGITIATSATASVEIVASITDPAFTATGQALFSLLRSGFGSTAGNFGAGIIIRRYGEKACYLTAALVVMGGIILYSTAQVCSRRESGKKLVGQVDSCSDDHVQDQLERSTSPAPVKLGQSNDFAGELS